MAVGDVPIRGDKVVIFKEGGFAELQVINDTSGLSGAIAYNDADGLIKFAQPHVVGGTLYIGPNEIPLDGTTGGNIYITASDADFIASSQYATYRLPDITADRAFNIPGGAAGDVFRIWVENNTPYVWIPTTGLQDAGKNPITELVNASYYTFEHNGTSWIKSS